MFKAHKWALILTILIILFISTLSSVSAQENSTNDTISKDIDYDHFLKNQVNNQDDLTTKVESESFNKADMDTFSYNRNLKSDIDPSNDDENQGDDENPSNYPEDNQNVDSTNDNTMDILKYYLDNSNYEEYMDYSFEENAIVYITEDIEGLDLFVEANNVTITGINNPTLKNSHITAYEEGYANISNMTFVSDDESEFERVIVFIGNNNSVSNVEFIDARYQPTEEEYRQIYVIGNNTSITNCNFDVRYPSQHRDWRFYGDENKENVVLLMGNNNNVTNCSINLIESGYYEAPYGMIRGISLYGNNNNVSNNTLYLQGTLYCYAISCRGSYNYISYNNIDVVSIRYANGITLEGQNAYNLVENNVISLQTSNKTIDDMELVDVSYGIILTENEYHGYTYYIPNSVTIYNVIRNNYIRGNSSHVYGIEQFGGTYTTIENNTIIVEGNTPMGIGLIGKGANITNNHIVAIGKTNVSGVSADYIKPETTAISLKDGSDNYVANNYLETHNGTNINIRNERRNLITKNTMNVLGNVRYVMGDRKVNGSVFTDNVIEGNPLYSSLNNELVYVKGHTYVDGVIVANDELDTYLATHKQDSNGTQARNDSESGQKENSTDYGNNTSADNNQTSTDTQSDSNPSTDTNMTNQTIIDDNINQNATNNQTTNPSNSTGTNTDDNQESGDDKSIIDIIIDKIDEIIDTNKTENNNTQNQSTENTTTDDNTSKNDTTEKNNTQEDNTNSSQTDVIIETNTTVPTDNSTQIPENTSQVIIEEPTTQTNTTDNSNNTSEENSTEEDNTDDKNDTSQDSTQQNNSIAENQTTEIIVTNQTINESVMDNQTTNNTQTDAINSNDKLNNTTDVLEEDPNNHQNFNNTNQTQIDTNSPVNNQEVNNTTITNTTIEAEIEVENSTIKNRTNESTGAGDLTPDSGNPTSAPDSSSASQSQAVTLESIMEDILSESTQESSPSTVGVTQTLTSSNAKVYEVSPKIVSKKMTMDEVKYLIAFMLILMSALIMGFKRVSV
ncbi:hypothetical protein [Methanosphaera sp. BMS]|uniref:hypothetical protein n=1 Tax=Methanosphaera sp. BMS TaxID=1789762 RepID=UPI000DC1C874|nr:hypothetical protein [Methanosphaera sp. BMS]AWX32156.1 hypothetical protein AW729_03155 [Methanosphaera sp. BMS]